MNTIAEHIADFLKKFPPFDSLTLQELSQIACNIRVVNIEKHKKIFKINDVLHDSFYVIASGSVNLSITADSEENVLNKCIEGDIFGLRPFFAKNNYMMDAKAREETILYAIPIAIFKPFVANNAAVLDYLLLSFANNSSNPNDKESLVGKLISDNALYTDPQSEMQYFQTLNYNNKPVLVSPTASVQEVAQQMTNSLSTCAIITSKNTPIGIVTNSDLCTKIATGKFPISTTIETIMSAPVKTIVEHVTLAEAQLLMLKNNVTHLCVTQDGSDKTLIKGVISEHDLIVAQASNPGVLVKEIKRSQNSKDLKSIRDRMTDLVEKSIHKNIPLSHVFNIASEINIAILKRSVELAILDLGSPPARYSWLSIGSQGRKEQLLTTDQDSILVFEDVPADQYRDVKDYFIKLGKKATKILENLGYQPCPNGHMASNILWCKSITEWTNQYNYWMNSPGEKNNNISSIFFDFEIVIGDKKIAEQLEKVIIHNLIENSLFFDYLGNNALKNNAPLTFFKKFIVEEDGPEIDKFDIKTRALMPLIDGARIFCLNLHVHGTNNTYLRFRQLSIVDPRNAEIYLNCAEAFLTLSRFRIIEAINNNSSGQFIDLNELTKLDKENLKNALEPMNELEDLIKDKFQLTHFS